MSKFNIGDEVWWGSIKHDSIFLTCPDCFGKKKLTVILGDDSRVEINCTGCEPGGCEPPKGIVHVYQYLPDIQKRTITGIEIRMKGEEQITEYKCDGWFIEETEVFKTYEEAKKRSDEVAKERSEEDMKSFYGKERPTHSWGWNATYHRSCIKRAEIDLAYHKEKLGIAILNRKSNDG